MTVSRDDILASIQLIAQKLEQNKDYLTELDAAIGDADHGINMDRGFRAVVERMTGVQDKDIGTIFKTVGMALVSTVGGAAGPLYGTFFLRMGLATAGKLELSDDDLLAMLEAGVRGVAERGKANLGDKTMVDVLQPAVSALREALASHAGGQEALRQAAAAADKGMKATIPMRALKGRASYLGERSVGHQDPGATSSCLILKALSDSLERRR
jgi:dihydroxyacetone kinase-like protein